MATVRSTVAHLVTRGYNVI